jgi:hypothetical protein
MLSRLGMGHSPRNTPRHIRERSRVTLQFTPEEKQAVAWLSRIPEPMRRKLPAKYRALAGSAARTIAKELSGSALRELAELHRNTTAPSGFTPPIPN